MERTEKGIYVILWRCASDPPKSEAFGGKNPMHMPF